MDKHLMEYLQMKINTSVSSWSSRPMRSKKKVRFPRKLLKPSNNKSKQVSPTKFTKKARF